MVTPRYELDEHLEEYLKKIIPLYFLYLQKLS